MASYLVTGANGFVGRTLCNALISRGHPVIACARNPDSSVCNLSYSPVAVINGTTNWQNLLSGVQVVIHLAARVHVMQDTAENPLVEFQDINLHGTTNLARQAAAAGVRRFLYVSSIKVNGEATSSHPFSESDTPAPQDPYALSKWQAEEALREISRETGMEIVIVRPPLVYGPGVKANFLSLLRLVDKALPLPLGKIDNRRSMIYVGNLVDALMQCAIHPAAAGQTYLVSDGESFSIGTLVRMLANSLNRPCRLLPIPLSWLKLVSGLLGKKAVLDRLAESLVINDSKIRRDLNWQPPFTVEQGLKATAEWYRATR